MSLDVKFRDANSRVDGLLARSYGTKTPIANHGTNLNDFIAWIEDWVSMLALADQRCRNYWTGAGYYYDLPWEV